MNVIRVGLSVLILALTACESTYWVHPKKSKDEFALDYNACETQSMQDPKLQGGTKLGIQQATERCLQKKGWVLPE